MEYISLSDIASYKQGRQVPVEEQSFYCEKGMKRFVRIVDFTNPGEAPRYINDLGSQYEVDEKSIVMIRYGSQTAGSIVRGISGIIANNMFQICINDERFDIDFMYYYLATPTIKSMLMSSQSSSTMPAITFGMMRQIQVPIRSIGEQRKIAHVLSIIDAKIEKNKQINRNLSEQAKAIFEHELLKFKNVPEGWTQGSLIDIADYLNGLAMQKFRPADEEEGIPVLKIKELRQGFCDTSSEMCSPSIKTEYIIHDGDVIFSWSGSLLVDFWCGGKCGLNQHLFKVTSDRYDKWFYYSWTLYHLDRFAAVAADKATTMGHIKRDELVKAEVLIPRKSDYERIGSIMAPIYDTIISNRIMNRKLAAMRDELLPQLMSGEIKFLEG